MSPSWEAIERIGRTLGVSEEAIRKWRVRGVSHQWRLKLVNADTRREINEADFDMPPGPRRHWPEPAAPPRRRKVA